MVSHIILVQAGAPSSLSLDETDLSLPSMESAHALGRHLADRKLLPAPSFIFGTHLCRKTAEIILHGAKAPQSKIHTHDDIAQIERHPLRRPPNLGANLSLWFDEQMHQFVASTPWENVMVVAPAFVVNALDQLTAVERRRAEYQPCEGFRIKESVIYGHFVAVEAIGQSAEHIWSPPAYRE